MCSEYDENLNENAFFKEITANHDDIIRRACKENWIICVPRCGSFTEEDITMENLLSHIIIPGRENCYCTLSKKQVSVKEKRIHVEDSELFTNSVEILFEETFYRENGLKHSVWCVDRLLFINYKTCQLHNKISLENTPDCIDFLWVESLSHEVLEHIQKQCANFVSEHEDFEFECLQTQKDLIGSLYSQCLQLCFKNSHIKKKSNASEKFMENLKIAVECYMQYSLGKTLIHSVNTLLCQTDSQINKIIRNSCELQLQEIGIDSRFCDVIMEAKVELSKINSFVTVLEKRNCLKRTFDALHCNVKGDCDFCVTSDDILQILVFLILKLNVNNWASNLIYLKEFRLSCLTTSDEFDFVITSLEAAIEFMKSNQFVELRSKSILIPENSSHLIVRSIFDNVRLGNVEVVDHILKQHQNKKNIEHNLCHPLCSCDKCENIVKNGGLNLKIDLKIKNDKGQSLLAYAAINGRCNCVEYFLKDVVDVNSVDYLFKTPLHYAALKGYQDILLLLINSGADVNRVDGEKNTALHLACENGHENCVKALIYSSPDLMLDCCNVYGETPLHLATKWGYLEIMRILLENGALTNIKNRRNLVAKDIASNAYSVKLLNTFYIEPNNNFVDDTDGFEIITNIFEDEIVECKDYGLKPKTVDQFKKIELLLKAIENNDLPLTCYYLGFTNNSRTEVVNGKCHPLCDCSKCTSNDLESALENIEISEKLNVNMCNASGYTPLHVAAQYSRSEILRLLLDSRALINVKTYNDLYTPLHLACRNENLGIVKELVECGGCKIDEEDGKGNSPLYYACMNNNARIVDILLLNGADCNKKNSSGRSILQETEENMLYGILKLLKASLKDREDCNDNWDVHNNLFI